MTSRLKGMLTLCMVASLCSACGGGGGTGGGSGSQTPPPSVSPPPPPPPPPPPVNHAPVMAPTWQGSPALIEAHPVDIDVARHFTDEDGDPITYTMTINLAGADGTWRGLKIVDGHVVGVPTLAGHFTNVAQSTVTIDLNDGHGGTSQWF